ncbi:hypothetical protein BDZ89DRAFT_1142170 [Hymenopellis radicata]|nr:hypothetical protein BDZ89DRAFT_1142170 [Hymenopellis radicata]
MSCKIESMCDRRAGSYDAQSPSLTREILPCLVTHGIPVNFCFPVTTTPLCQERLQHLPSRSSAEIHRVECSPPTKNITQVVKNRPWFLREGYATSHKVDTKFSRTGFGFGGRSQAKDTSRPLKFYPVGRIRVQNSESVEGERDRNQGDERNTQGRIRFDAT